MIGRTIAIGDIHGCSTALAALINVIAPKSSDTIITLGDYVDGGLDSKGVLDQLIALKRRCRLVPILGNHDEMMLKAQDSKAEFRWWMNCGGITTLDSYGDTGRANLIPEAHIRFLKQCVEFFETDRHIFVHANYKPTSRLEEMDGQTLRWLSLTEYMPLPHCSGKIAFLGHTPQTEILDAGHLVCLDTGCASGGVLTAIEVDSHQCWQVDERGMDCVFVP